MADIVVSHGCANLCKDSSLVPQVVTLTGVKDLTHDVKLFTFKTLDGKAPFDSLPGQLGMFSVPPHGECMFCITCGVDDYVEMAVKRVGPLPRRCTSSRWAIRWGMRGPYGNWFPRNDARRDMLPIAGGIGMAPQFDRSWSIVFDIAKSTAASTLCTARRPTMTSYSKKSSSRSGPRSPIPMCT